jgi:hypothetical protein
LGEARQQRTKENITPSKTVRRQEGRLFRIS